MIWLFALVPLCGLVGIYTLLVNDMAKGLEEQQQRRLALEKRLRHKGII